MTELPPQPVPEAMLQDGRLDLGDMGAAFWVTDVGHYRSRNEDRLLVKSVWDDSYILLLVADGAGGHEAGDKAAEMTVFTFDTALSETGSPPPDGPRDVLYETIVLAHANVCSLATGGLRPPASTVVGILVERSSLCGWRFHVGDSRLYSRMPGAEIIQLTRDHNITNGLIDRGLPPSQAMKIAEGGRLTQVLGGGTEPAPEVHGPLQLQPGQCLLAASDGVFGHNEDRDPISPALDGKNEEASERAAKLKTAVLDGPAPDNLTFVTWEVPQEVQSQTSRTTVTNSMRAVTPDDIALAIAEEGLRDQGFSSDQDELSPAPVSGSNENGSSAPSSQGRADSRPAPLPALFSIPSLVATLLVLAVVLSALRVLSFPA